MVAYDRGPSPLFDDNDDGEVWVMNADGTEARQITRNAVPEYGAELSPDNQWVVFRADSNTDGEFYYNDKVYLASASGEGGDNAAYRPPSSATSPTKSAKRFGARTRPRFSCRPTRACAKSCSR